MNLVTKLWYMSRWKVKIKPYPYFPRISELMRVIELISILEERR
jgi:hypothetical protein